MLVKMTPQTKHLHVTSPLYGPSNTTCKLQFWLYQEKMYNGTIKVTVDESNRNQLDIDLIQGNDTRR